MRLFKRKKQESLEVVEEVLSPEPEKESVHEYMLEVADYLEHRLDSDVRTAELTALQQRLNDLLNEQ